MTEVQRLAAFCSEGVIKVVAQFQPQTLSVGDMFRVASRRQTFMFRATVASYMSLTNDNFLLKGLEVPFEALSPGAVARPFSRAQLRNVKTIAYIIRYEVIPKFGGRSPLRPFLPTPVFIMSIVTHRSWGIVPSHTHIGCC